MDVETILKTGDRVFVMTAEEALSRYEEGSDGEIEFPETGGFCLARRPELFRQMGGRTAVIMRVNEVLENHFHYLIDLDGGEWAWCPSMFTGFAEDEEEIEPPDPMSIWYFLGIEENRNPRKKK